VFLLLSDRQDADQLARDLDAKGWSCAVESEQYGRVVTQIQDCRPVAAIIDVSKASERGIEAAAAIRSAPATQTVPIVFVGANRVVDQVKAPFRIRYSLRATLWITCSASLLAGSCRGAQYAKNDHDSPAGGVFASGVEAPTQKAVIGN